MKKEKLQFKVGDIVKITDFGKIYSTYESMFVKMGFKKRNFNDCDMVDTKGMLGEVFAVDHHEIDGDELVGVLLEDGREILIGCEGIERLSFVKSSQKSQEVDAKSKLSDDDFEEIAVEILDMIANDIYENDFVQRMVDLDSAYFEIDGHNTVTLSSVELRQDEYPFQKYMENNLIQYLKAKLA